jgi:hypothetical protein
MNILIDNKDLSQHFGIEVLDYTGVYGFPTERENEREWYNKSGVDKNLINTRYEAKEFTIECYVKANNEALAYNIVNTLVEYMLEKKVFVLSLRDTPNGVHECFLCERSKVIVPKINIRQQNSLYTFKLGLKDVNPNAIKYKTTIASNTATIEYTKGRTASIFWGNGDNGLVENSGDYTKDDYSDDGLVDIIIDLDKDLDAVGTINADFQADLLSGVKIQDIQFTDLSTGDISVWSWAISKGGIVKYTSAEQNPLISFDEDGVFTVTLQVFNNVAGADTETKTDYITIRNSRLLINSSGDSLLINSTDKLLKN